MAKRSTWFSLGALACLATGLLGATVTLALTSGPEEPPAVNPDQPITVQVSDDRLRHVVTADVAEQPAATIQVRRQGVVTAAGPRNGATLQEGSVVAIVDEQATLLLKGQFPLYRELAVGRSGQDVAQIRQALARLGFLKAPGPAVFDQETAQALIRLYQRSGHPLRDAHGNPATPATLVLSPQLVAVTPAVPAVAVGNCGDIGASAKDALCTVRTRQATLLLQVPTGADGVKRGQPAELVLADGRVVAATVDEPLPRSDDAQPQRFSLVTGSGKLPAVADVSRASVVVGQAPAGALTVPAAAIRDVSGSKGRMALQDGSSAPVTIGLCAQGRCVVAGDDVRKGMTVVVP